MRFSIRWMLAAMAYIALVAAAISTRHPILTDLVWVVAQLAFCFALVVAAVDRGRRRAMALGFVALMAIQIACINIAPTKGPTSWLYRVAGYIVRDQVIYERPAPAGGANARPGQGLTRASSDVPSVSLTNGVISLLAGFLGSWIGLIAWKQQDATNQATSRHAE